MDTPKTRRPACLKKFMHHRNPYKTLPSFKKLAITYPEFREHCTFDASGKVHLDFKNPAALSTLTTCLLQQDFDLDVVIPANSLVPTLPLRFNYLLWIEDLLNIVYPKLDTTTNPIIGYDIGTGASCIYPLLGTRQLKWTFLASEKDENSYSNALKNISRNNMEDKIMLRNINDDSGFFNLLREKDVQTFLKKVRNIEGCQLEEALSGCAIQSPNSENKLVKAKTCDETLNYMIDFTMCNPPFFSSEDEIDTVAKSRKERSEPTSAPTGMIHEKVTEGGEIAFIRKLIQESLKNKTMIRIFSSLIGKKSDLQAVKKELLQVGVAHYKVTEFCQGRTMRWGVAWTFDSAITLEKNQSKKEQANVKPQIILVPRTLLFQYDIAGAWKLVSSWLKELKIKPRVFRGNKFFVGAVLKAYKPTWLNQRKKRREKLRLELNKQQTANKRDLEEDESSENSPKKQKSDSGLEDPDELEMELFNHSPEKMSDINSCPLEDDPLLSGQDTDPINGEGTTTPKVLECILKCSIHVTLISGNINIELTHIGGSAGKVATNQLLQFMRNRLSCPVK